MESGLRTSEEVGRGSETDLNAAVGPGSGTATPEVGGATDDPSRFENAKQRKTTLLQGIKKFNFKPKRVRSSALGCEFLWVEWSG